MKSVLVNAKEVLLGTNRFAKVNYNTSKGLIIVEIPWWISIDKPIDAFRDFKVNEEIVINSNKYNVVNHDTYNGRIYRVSIKIDK